MKYLVASVNVLSVGIILIGETFGLFVGITSILMMTTATLVLIDNKK